MSLLVPEITKPARTRTVRRRRIAPIESFTDEKSQETDQARQQSEATLEFLSGTRPSDKTGRILQGLLGLATCVAVIGFITSNQTPGISPGSPDAPAPAVFSHTD